jgi:hypothetical protein
MEVSLTRQEMLMENTVASAAGNVGAKIETEPVAAPRPLGGEAVAVRRDPYAEQRLARKKKMRAAHRRRLKSSYANG